MLRVLAEDAPTPTDIEDNDTFQELCDYYDGPSDFIEYAPISAFVYERGKDVSAFKTALKQAVDATEDTLSVSSIRGLHKMLDHMELAAMQLNHFNLEQEREIRSQNAQLKNLQSDIEKSKSNLRDVKDLKGSIYGDFIAILGIFSALIFSLFGGFSTISKIISETSSEERLYRVVISTSLLGIVLLCLLFFLLKAIAMMSDKEINNPNGKSPWGKYPFFMWGLTLLVVLFLLSVAYDFAIHFGFTIPYTKLKFGPGK